MKRILLTNYRIKDYTGSELDTLSIANYFLNNNWQVDIFTLDFGAPLNKIINSKINVYTFAESDKLCKKYDLIWAHHWPLLDYLLFYLKIKAKYVHYVSLSSFEPYEDLPVYYQHLSLISAITREAINTFKNEGYNVSKMKLFPNYAEKSFFNKNHKVNKKIKSICIVSNHIPNELYELKDILLLNNIKVDLYGYGNIQVVINEKILNKYDVVISIGKTINYALAIGIPAYCYDHFGGDGYITEKNVVTSESCCFSARLTGKKMSATEIYNDIINNYEMCCQNLKFLKDYALKNFSLENNINKVLDCLNNNNVVDYSNLYKEFRDLPRKSLLYVREVGNRNYIINGLSNEKVIYLRQLKEYDQLSRERLELIDNLQKEKRITDTYKNCLFFKLFLLFHKKEGNNEKNI